MSRVPFLISLFAVRALFGQSSPVDPQSPPASSAVQVKRIQGAPTSAAPDPGSFVDQFDFGANVRALAQSMEKPPEAGTPAPLPHGESTVPKDYHPTTDVTLSTTAKQAVE